jgi:hypothetical protein
MSVNMSTFADERAHHSSPTGDAFLDARGLTRTSGKQGIRQ